MISIRTTYSFYLSEFHLLSLVGHGNACRCLLNFLISPRKLATILWRWCCGMSPKSNEIYFHKVICSSNDCLVSWEAPPDFKNVKKLMWRGVNVI